MVISGEESFMSIDGVCHHPKWTNNLIPSPRSESVTVNDKTKHVCNLMFYALAINEERLIKRINEFYLYINYDYLDNKVFTKIIDLVESGKLPKYIVPLKYRDQSTCIRYHVNGGYDISFIIASDNI